jgi:V/A-type H+-transporting ATPase subunit I
MIAKMLKTYVVSRRQQREDLLEALRTLGVMHLAPVDRGLAVAHEETVATIDRLRRAQQLLGAIKPAGTKPHDVTTVQAAEEALAIHRAAAERRNRLGNLHRQINHLAVWGDVRLEQFAALREAGVRIGFYTLPARDAGAIQADLVQVVADRFGRGVLVAVVQRDGEAKIPDSAEPVELPPRDRSSLRGEAAEIDKQLADDEKRLAGLAHFAKGMQEETNRLTATAQFTIADRGGLAEGELYAVQGWVPADKAEHLRKGLAGEGIDAGVEVFEPQESDHPPTLIELPRWARPIQGLMKILGLSPGYNEQDVSIGFMIALPIFAAMLISDAGYGLMMALLPIVLRRKVVAKMGANVANLMIVIGAVSIVWGGLTGSFFGLDVPGMFHGKPLIVVSLDEAPMRLLMRISFTIGLIHLIIAQLWRAATMLPDLRALAKVGWAIFLGGMYGLVCMFVLSSRFDMSTPWPYMMMAGTVLILLFTSPSWNILKAVGLGLANFPLPALGTFSDIMSYVRLMAVGLAGSVLASSFNDLAASTGPILMVPILIFGHGLNVGLCLIALFAHGVRLNVLEFSNNFGLEWSGYPYHPFGREQLQEN